MTPDVNRREERRRAARAEKKMPRRKVKKQTAKDRSVAAEREEWRKKNNLFCVSPNTGQCKRKEAEILHCVYNNRVTSDKMVKIFFTCGEKLSNFRIRTCCFPRANSMPFPSAKSFGFNSYRLLLFLVSFFLSVHFLLHPRNFSVSHNSESSANS